MSSRIPLSFPSVWSTGAHRKSTSSWLSPCCGHFLEAPFQVEFPRTASEPECLAFSQIFPTAPMSTPPAVLRTTKAALAHVGHRLVQEEHLRAPPPAVPGTTKDALATHTLFVSWFLSSRHQRPMQKHWPYMNISHAPGDVAGRCLELAGQPLQAGLFMPASAGWPPHLLAGYRSIFVVRPLHSHIFRPASVRPTCRPAFACKLLQATLCSQVSASRSLQKASAGRLMQADRCSKAKTDRPLQAHICC